MRVALSATAGILSALAPLLIMDTGFPSVGVSTSIRAAGAGSQVYVTCPELEVAGLDCELSFLCDPGTGVIVALDLMVLLRYRCSSRVEPAPLRVRRVRLAHREDVGVNCAQSRISDRRVVRERFFEIITKDELGILGKHCWLL